MELIRGGLYSLGNFEIDFAAITDETQVPGGVETPPYCILFR